MASETRKYYLGKGKFKLFRKLANGLPGALFFWSNAPTLKLSVTVEKKEHVESYSGTNAVDNTVIIKSACEGSVEIDELTPESYELLTKGTKREIASGSFEDYVIDTPVNGAEYRLPGTGLTNIVVKDSAATPATVSNTKYSFDPVFGSFTVIDTTGTTGNWTVEGDFEEVTVVTMLDSSDKDLFLVYEGKNLADNSNVLLEIPLARFEPSSETDFIGDDYAKYPLNFSVLPDAGVTTDPNFEELGNFGRLVFLS